MFPRVCILKLKFRLGLGFCFVLSNISTSVTIIILSVLTFSQPVIVN